jgi:hypothetical protein
MSTNNKSYTYIVVKHFIQNFKILIFMKTNLFKFQLLFILFLGMFIASCTDSTSTDDALADDYAEETVLRTQDSIGVGKKGCFELVFPITITFGDNSTASVDSYDSMKEAIKAWRTNNPESKIRPKITLPFEVIKPDGEFVSITTDLEARALRALCGKPGHGPMSTKGPHGQGIDHKACFKPVFPFTVILPDGNEYVINSPDDRKGLHDALKAYFKANPGKKGKPELKFPAKFELSDGTITTVASKAELTALKDSCD